MAIFFLQVDGGDYPQTRLISAPDSDAAVEKLLRSEPGVRVVDIRGVGAANNGEAD